jgi:hypothetical protein
MVRINKEEIKGITDNRKKLSCAEGDNNTASVEEEAGIFCCEDAECLIDWHEE